MSESAKVTTLEIPEFLKPPKVQTFELLIDGKLPVITLTKALSAFGLSIKHWEGRLVLTAEPEKFS